MTAPTDNIQVLIQSRLSSARLSAKGLLPIKAEGTFLPSVVLCAKRAANTGLNVTVVTSNHPSDDPTAEVLARYDVPVFRGSLDNVLERFVEACTEQGDDTIIVRLTADNLFPDGAFVEELVAQMGDKALQYLGTKPPEDGLPYGLSAEAMTLGVLREACKSTTHPYDLEHVTPWICNKYGTELFFKPAQFPENTVGMEKLRCTMDTFDDYLRVFNVFNVVEEPVSVSWQNLCKILCETAI